MIETHYSYEIKRFVMKMCLSIKLVINLEF